MSENWVKFLEKVNKQKRPLFLFLDFDGTLTRIVGSPRDAYLDEEMRTLLKQLMREPHLQIGIVSGRSLADLVRRVALKGLFFAGNHGLEILAGKKTFFAPKAKAHQKILSRVAQRLRSLTIHPGILLEDKKLSISLHYRLATRAIQKKVKSTAKKMLAPFLDKKNICLRYEKQCLEIRPNLPWNKGKAVLWLLEHAHKKPAPFPIYLGDDETDEDAFRALNHLTPPGMTIRVGKKKDTAARYSLPNLKSVKLFLTSLQTLGAR